MKNKYLLRSVKKRYNKLSIILVIMVMAILATVLGVANYNLSVKKAEVDKKRQQLTEQIEAENKRTLEIEEYSKYTQTKKFAEEVAKEKLGLVKDNEIIFKGDSSQ